MAVKARLITEELVGGGFMLVELKGSDLTPVYDSAGQLLKFRTGEEAAAACREESDKRGGAKIQPRQISDKNWRDREAMRLKDGTYKPLPWADTKWWGELADIHKDHYPHVSTGKTTLIAITEDDGKGAADIQTPMKPGKYLERYFGQRINEYMRRDLTMIFLSKFEDNQLQFAVTEEEIEEIFSSGPSSCMSKRAEDYGTDGIHPTRMYAAGDLQVAYMRRQGKIAARTVVWPEKKTYNTIYGDSGRLTDLLKKEGYKQGVPIGARLKRQKMKRKEHGQGHVFIVPHADNTAGVVDRGDYLILSDGKGKDADVLIGVPGGSGKTEICGFVCAKCKKDSFTQRHIKSMYQSNDSNAAIVCNSCTREHTVTCASTGSLIDKDYAVRVGKQWIWQRELAKATFRCAGSGELHLKAEMVTMPDGSAWSKAYAAKHARPCKCGAFVPNDQVCGDAAECHYRKPTTRNVYGTVSSTIIAGGSTGKFNFIEE